MVNWLRVFRGRYHSQAINRNIEANVKHAEKLGNIATECTDNELKLISK
jgi:hypothetical protein